MTIVQGIIDWHKLAWFISINGWMIWGTPKTAWSIAINGWTLF